MVMSRPDPNGHLLILYFGYDGQWSSGEMAELEKERRASAKSSVSFLVLCCHRSRASRATFVILNSVTCPVSQRRPVSRKLNEHRFWRRSTSSLGPLLHSAGRDLR